MTDFTNMRHSAIKQCWHFHPLPEPHVIPPSASNIRQASLHGSVCLHLPDEEERQRGRDFRMIRLLINALCFGDAIILKCNLSSPFGANHDGGYKLQTRKR